MEGPHHLIMETTMRTSVLIVAMAIALPAAGQAQSSNTSSNSSSNNGVVRERTVDTYCDQGYCTRTVERNVYHDGSNRDWQDRDHDDRDEWRDKDERKFTRWALRNFDANHDGRLGRREYQRAIAAWRR